MPATETPAARFYRLARRRLRDVEPSVRAAYLRTLRLVSEDLAGLTEREVLDYVVSKRALLPFRVAVQDAVRRGVVTFARDIPGARRSGEVVSLVREGSLNSRVLEAIRTADNVVTERFTGTARASLRAIVEKGYERGWGVRETAREARKLIGLSPTELQQVDNFRAALMGMNGRRWQDYARRDRRFDATVRKAMEGGGLRPDQVERMVGAYAKRRLALSAEANARTATLDAYKRAQKTAWQVAVDSGAVDGSRLMKEWIGVGDTRERPEHLAMNGETVPFGMLFSNGDDIPGAGSWNCRCWPRYFEARTK